MSTSVPGRLSAFARRRAAGAARAGGTAAATRTTGVAGITRPALLPPSLRLPPPPPLPLLLVFLLGALLPGAASAQSPGATSASSPGAAPAQSSLVLDPVIVTANRVPERLSATLADASVLERQAIERSGAIDVAELLARLPGIEFARNGGLGTVTGVFLRGSENRHTAVYLDGVRIDSQATGGALWEQIPLEQIDRIEVVRGPAAAVYGSDAVGGVVQLFTRRGEEGAARPTAGLAVGTYGTVQAQAGISGAAGGLDYSINATHGRSRGFNSQTTPGANPDDDGWRRSALQSRLGLQLAPGHRVEAVLLASNLRSQYDDPFNDNPDKDDVARHQLRTASLSWQGRWSEAWSSRLRIGESISVYENQPSFYRTETRLRDFSFQPVFRPNARQQITATLERREDRLHNDATAFSAALDGARAQNGAALGWRGDFDAHAFQAHLRHDRDSEFGGKSTGSLAWGWRFAPGWRFSASAGTSFRAPTLYQRFSEFGVASLVPESGRNVELGLRRAGAAGEVSLTAWRNALTDLIAFGAPGRCVSGFGCYENVSRARYEGVTLAGRARAGRVDLHGSLDWHDPRNLDTDRLLPRRARRLATFGADADLAGWTVGAELQAAGPRYEDDANSRPLGGYGLIALRAGTRLQPGLLLEGRVDNLADKRYELVQGYATPGRAFRVALRWTPR